MNRVLNASLLELGNILKHTLGVDDAIDWESLKSKKSFKIKPESLFEGGKQPRYIKCGKSGEPQEVVISEKEEAPEYEVFYNSAGWFSKMFSSEKIKRKFESKMNEWKEDCIKTDAKNAKKRDVFKASVTDFEEKKSVFLRAKKDKNDAVDKAKTLYESGTDQAIEEYCDMVLNNSEYPDILNMSWKINYNSETKSLVIDYELPSPSDLPLVDSYKFVKSKNEIQDKPLTLAKKKALYADVLFQICIRSIHEVIEADKIDGILVVAFNGVVTSLNEGTGKMEEKVIMSVVTSKDEFLQINLGAVVAEKTFEHLKGVAGKVLLDQVAVTPVAAIEKIKKAS